MLGWLRRIFGRSSSGASRFDAGTPTECNCGCHTNLAIQHYAPCCTWCETCQKRFTAGMAKHRATCGRA